MTQFSKTEYGLPIDQSFATPAAPERLELASKALREHGHDVRIVDDADAARELVLGMLPTDQMIFTSTSETLRKSGITEAIDNGERFTSVRERLATMDDATRKRQLGAAPDVVVGSVHAITEDGRMVIASATGSQLGPYAAGARRAIWVVGAQKIVSDLETALRRIETYSYPLEDARARLAYGAPSSIGKILIINRENAPERTTVVLMRAPLGY